MIGRHYRVVLLLGLSFLGGCIVSPAAKTILTAEVASGKETKKITFGVRKVNFYSKGNNEVVIFGYGSHPREHETYAFFACEGFPCFAPRFIRITNQKYYPDSKRPCHLELIVVPYLLNDQKITSGQYQHFAGPIPEPCKTWLGNMVIDLKQVQLKRVDSDSEPKEILLSGKIIATKGKKEMQVRIEKYWKEVKAKSKQKTTP